MATHSEGKKKVLSRSDVMRGLACTNQGLIFSLSLHPLPCSTHPQKQIIILHCVAYLVQGTSVFILIIQKIIYCAIKV